MRYYLVFRSICIAADICKSPCRRAPAARWRKPEAGRLSAVWSVPLLARLLCVISKKNHRAPWHAGQPSSRNQDFGSTRRSSPAAGFWHCHLGERDLSQDRRFGILTAEDIGLGSGGGPSLPFVEVGAFFLSRDKLTNACKEFPG